MELIDAVLILKYHNKWRRGDETIPMADPKQLGIAIDLVVDVLEKRLKTDYNNN